MDLLNVSPIQAEIKYKQINIEDFHSDGYAVSKNLITATSEGYISNQIQEVIRFDEKSTVVINAGVGQGKTFTVMQIAKQYYDQDFLLVFAVPYKSLIDQYRNELTDLNIDYGEIFDYRNLGETIGDSSTTSPHDASLLNIHLLTINCLLGNPGDDFLEQSKAKSDYIHYIIERCSRENKKVLLIMDEIHDGIHNFKQHFIFNLWRWKSVLHKILVVSATYNEAAKVVIKYLAELTNNTIQIIESRRTKVESKQSDLFLLLYNKANYDTEDDELVSIFETLLSKDKVINVLSYSRSICENIIDQTKKIGALLHDKFGSDGINLCTGDTNNIFDPVKCNIGTTFSTGINIKGNDSAFIVLLPSLYSVKERRTGIFSTGINTLIQALARVRDKSEIYIILPSPKYLLSNFGSHEVNYTDSIKSIPYFQQHNVWSNYEDINNQKSLIASLYNQIRAPLNETIEEIKSIYISRENKPSLNYPSLDDYILSTGEQVLYSKYDIFGKDLSVYTFWAAFNDQFLNCRLKAISVINVLKLEDGRILNQLKDFVNRQFLGFQTNPDAKYGKLFYFNLLSDKEFYTELRDAIYKNRVQLVSTQDNGTVQETTVRPYRKVSLEQKILTIVQLVKKPYSRISRRFYSENSLASEINMTLNNDVELNELELPLSDTEYLLSCFSHSLRTDLPDNLREEEKELITHYKHLASFCQSFKQRFALTDEQRKVYFDRNIDFNANITVNELETIYNSISYIKNHDPVLSKKVISFMQNLPDTFTSNEDFILNNIYSKFRNTFFITSEERVDIGQRVKRPVIKKVYNIPHYMEVINLLFITTEAPYENYQSHIRDGDAFLSIPNESFPSDI
jgi:hypothetical protein